MLTYLILFGLFALWVLFDGFTRKMGVRAVLWAAGTALLGALILPIYLAKRPLKTGEVREGGTAWNVLKDFAVLWTIVMVITALTALKAAGGQTLSLNSDAARAGAGIGMFLGLAMLGAMWFFPMVGAAGLGFFLKKNSIVEHGPTGPLIGEVSRASVVSGWGGILVAAVIALVLLTVNDHKPVSVATKSAFESSTDSKARDATTTPVPPVESVGWRSVDKRNDMDGTREVSLVLKSRNEVEGFIGSNRPSLGIRCAKHKPEVFISVGTPFESESGEYDTTNVRIKFDGGIPAKQKWTEASNREAAFASSPARLVRQLSASKEFVFEFTPFEKRATTVTFDTGGLREKLEPLADICGLQ